MHISTHIQGQGSCYRPWVYSTMISSNWKSLFAWDHLICHASLFCPCLMCLQGWFLTCAQPMRDVVTKRRRLSLAGRKLRTSPVFIYYPLYLHQWWPISLTHIYVPGPQYVNSSHPGPNGRHFADDIFRCIFFRMKCFVVFNSNFTEACPQGSNWQ